MASTPEEHSVNGLKLEGDSSALIDVGGGTGQVVEELRIRVSNWKRRLILQEQKSAIDLAKLSKTTDRRVELMMHDFF